MMSQMMSQMNPVDGGEGGKISLGVFDWVDCRPQKAFPARKNGRAEPGMTWVGEEAPDLSNSGHICLHGPHLERGGEGEGKWARRQQTVDWLCPAKH